MDTERFIHALAEDVEPVRRLARPAQRTIVWAAVTVAYLAVLVLVMSPRGDLGARVSEPRFLIEQTAALLTGLAAAAAAFATVVPGYRGTTVWLPMVPLSVWVGTVGAGAAQEFALAGAAILVWQPDWACVGAILAGAAVPGVLMSVMLRRGAPVAPHVSAAFGALAAAGLGNLGVCLFHPHSSNLILLFWHCGTVLVLASLAGVAGGRILQWPPRNRASLLA